MKRMHVLAFMIHSPINHTILSWAHPRDQRIAGFDSPDYWQNIARVLEAGRFDGLFFADVPGIFDVYRDSIEPTVKYGVCFPTHDPVPLIPIMALATQHLGIASTMSTTVYPPYLLVRIMSTLDHLTGGRVGWNVVTGHVKSESLNMGLNDQLPHDERYDRAEEYLEVCHKLWNSWEPGAVRLDREGGIFADPDKVHRINHVGKYFSCPGPSPVLPSPQGKPVIFQAGSSGRGRDFAARHADAVFGLQLTPAAMRSFADDIRRRAVAQGRGPNEIKIIFGVQVIVGETEEAARAKQRALLDRIPLEAALARLSGSTGFDLAGVDLDAPLQEMQVPGAQGIIDMFTRMHGSKITLREAAVSYGATIGMPQVVGTPEQVADQLAYLFSEGGGDGFNLTPTYTPSSFTEFVEMVVPLLQKRGLYRKEYEGTTFRANLLAD